MNLVEIFREYGYTETQEHIWAALYDPGYRERPRNPLFREIGVLVAQALRDRDIVSFNKAVRDLDAHGMDTAWLFAKYRSKFGIELKRCVHCHEWKERDRHYIMDHNANRICDVCLQSVPTHFVWSQCHECYCRRGNAVPIYASIEAINRGDDPIEWAMSGQPIPSNEYFRTPDTGMWIKGRPNYRTLYKRYYDVGQILPYHASKAVVGHVPSMYDHDTPRLLMGFELEVVGITSSSSAVAVTNIRKYRDDLFAQTKVPYVECEHDGSLGSNGFEIVSSYTGLDVHEQLARNLLALPAFKNLRSHDTTNCGLHVHLDKAGISIFHAAKLVSFIHDPANLPLMVTIGRRTPQECERYARFADKKQIYRWSKEHYEAVVSAAQATQRMTDRYEAINMTPERTIEFRLYRGTTRFTTLMACLEFSRLAWLFARDSSLKEMSTPNFLRYIERPEHHRESRYLRRRLKRNGFEVAYKPQEITYTIAETFNMRKAA